jgi:hypothetical protein
MSGGGRAGGHGAGRASGHGAGRAAAGRVSGGEGSEVQDDRTGDEA